MDEYEIRQHLGLPASTEIEFIEDDNGCLYVYEVLGSEYDYVGYVEDAYECA